MAGRGRKTLQAWIGEALSDIHKEHQCSAFSLMHVQGSQQLEIHSVRIKGGSAPSAQDLAELFQGKADVFSQDLPGTQTFNLQAFYNQDRPEAFYPFVVQGYTFGDPGNGNGNGLMTEAPTESGRTQQSMRHSEAFTGQIYRRQEALDQFCMRMIQFQGQWIEKLQRETIDSATVIRDVVLKQAEVSHQYKMKELEFERQTEERRKLIGMVPALANTISGHEVFPQSTEDSAIIDGLITMIIDNPQLAHMISGMVPPALQGIVANRIQRGIKKREDELAAKQKLAVYKGNPLDDVTGGPEAE